MRFKHNCTRSWLCILGWPHKELMFSTAKQINSVFKKIKRILFFYVAFFKMGTILRYLRPGGAGGAPRRPGGAGGAPRRPGGRGGKPRPAGFGAAPPPPLLFMLLLLVLLALLLMGGFGGAPRRAGGCGGAPRLAPRPA